MKAPTAPTRSDWDKGFAAWRPRIFWILWLTYGAFYLCRQNLSVALPAIGKEFNWSKAEVGTIGTALFWAYAAGQFVNGQLVDKYGARLILPVGIIVSALANVFIGLTGALGILTSFMAVWAVNGYFQAMGWPCCIKTLANWFSPKERGTRMGIFGASYQVGNVVTWVLAGWLAANVGWRASFWVPGLIFLAFALITYVGIRGRPEAVGLPSLEEYEQHVFTGETKTKAADEEHMGFRYTLSKTVGNPRVWAVAWSFFFVDVIRYGFMLWAPTYLLETQKAGIDKAAYTSIAMPLFGIPGAIFTGWATDRFFQSRRAPMVAILMAILGVLAWSYRFAVPEGAWVLSFLVLGLIGFCVLGAQVTLVGAVPMDFGTRKAAASAAGFIDCFGYIGAGLTGVLSGFLTDKFGWDAAFYFWICSAFASAAICATLWAYKPPPGKYL
ncbi:MAG: MFS transporter [Planctomycetes bacterium]|nr:MFS transporter [Planctomycetota bacterium]